MVCQLKFFIPPLLLELLDLRIDPAAILSVYELVKTAVTSLAGKLSTKCVLLEFFVLFHNLNRFVSHQLLLTRALVENTFCKYIHAQTYTLNVHTVAGREPTRTFHRNPNTVIYPRRPLAPISGR